MPDIQLPSLFDEIVVLLLIATIAGVVATRLRQPPIIGFIAVGILAGPSGLKLLESTEEVHLLAEMGLALLLFIVGLKLDLTMMRSMGVVSLVIGLSQVAITTAGGYVLSRALGMSLVTSLYVAAALTFSSTIIIVKLLSDRRETESLHGRIALGLLIVQDLVVVLLMVFLSAFSGGDPDQAGYQTLLIVAKGALLVGLTWFLSALVVPRMLARVARSSELLVLFGIVWALALAAAGDVLGFSKEIGAFVAGVSLASTQYREAIGARLSSLRDFLLLFFFIELGGAFDAEALGPRIWAAIPLSLFALVAKPVIVFVITVLMGYRQRTSLLAGLTVGQVSEFSLILAALGARFGHIGGDVVGLITLVALVTIGLSTYTINYSRQISDRLAPFAGLFGRRAGHRESSLAATSTGPEPADTMIFGLGSYGTRIAEQLEDRGRRVVGIDFDPEAVGRWNARQMPAVFGDVRDPDFARTLHLEGIRWAISSIRDRDVNLALLEGLRHSGYTGRIAAAAYDEADCVDLSQAGADLVFSPFDDAAVQAVDLVFATEDQIARKAMDKLIESMSDHYIVCGYGRMGQQIVKDLNRYNVPCVVVEWNPEQLPKLKAQEIPHVEGKATEDISLIRAGVERAKGLIAVAASDEENVFIVLTAKVLNPKLFVVARSILQENEDKLRHAGANRVMSPYVLGGRRMAAAVIRPEVMDFLDLVVHEDSEDTEMATITIGAGSACIGKTLAEVNPWMTCGVTLLAARRRGEDLHPNPSPEFVLREGDELIVMGTADQIESAKGLVVGAGA